MAIDYKSLKKLGGSEFGNIDVDINTTFQAGQIATYDTNGAATLAASGDNPVGVFKWNKASTLYGTEAREAVTVVALATAYNLDHANVSNVKVEDLAGTDYTAGAGNDYTVNATNGTITTTASGTTTISAGEVVYVTYTYEKSASDLEQDGVNFFNSNDDTQGSNKVVLLQGGWHLETDQFDTAQDYTVNDQLYVDDSGKFSTNAALSGGNKFGKVVSIPTAANPFLGVEGTFLTTVN